MLTARELFYSAAEAPKPAAAPPAAATQPPAAKSAPKKTPPPVVATAKRQPAVETAPPKEALTAATRPKTPDGTGRVSTASSASAAPAPANGPALGLKYSILKREGDRTVDVPPDSVFHAGDRIQFAVETNGPGYLYIVGQGSSGTWKPMFPSPEIAEGDNRVQGFQSYTMPPSPANRQQERVFTFDEQKGIEKVFIVFSREPETDLENMIYSLQKPKRPSEPRESKQMLVAVNVDDATVGRLRKTYARDLIIETVTPSNSGAKKENAKYVVNPSGNSDSRIVADLSLVHQ